MFLGAKEAADRELGGGFTQRRTTGLRPRERQ